jgi:hypothetical protein
MSAFSEHCGDIIKDYVQTVLIIDDRAGLGPQVNDEAAVELEGLPVDNPLIATVASVESAEEVTENINEIIALGGGRAIESAEEAAERVEEFPYEIDESSSHELNALELTNAFYQKGIVAGLYQPLIVEGEGSDDFANKAEGAAATADIIILDWMLKGSDSSYSQAIVKKIIDLDRNSGGRIRNIIIYTGEPNLSDLKDELYRTLDDESIDTTTEFQLSSKNLKISFYNKPNSSGRSDREVNACDLPEKALEAFKSLVDGLVPAFAMKAAATIRQNTGRIISRFGSNLDAAYLAHRALLTEPEDSEVFMLENYVSYLRNILSISRVDTQTLGSDSIDDWLGEKQEYLSKKIDFDNHRYEISLAGLKSISKLGFKAELYEVLSKEHPGIAESFKDTNKPCVEKAISVFDSTNGSTVIDSSIELSILSTFRRTFKDIAGQEEKPYLTQGSLIYSKADNQFLLCLTPKCDTVRLKEPSKFSFAILERKLVSSTFDIVAPIMEEVSDNLLRPLKEVRESVLYKIIDNRIEQGKQQNSERNELYKTHGDNEAFMSLKGHVFLNTNLKFCKLEHISFSSDGNERVNPNLTEEQNHAFWDDEVNEYIWLGDMKDMDTQKRVSNLVGNLNRVGLDEVEWLRRQYQ